MKRRLAFLVYFVGTLSALSALGSGLGGVLWAFPIWWITVGIGVRLGVFPIEFFKSLKEWLGFGYEVPVEGPTRVPEGPPDNDDRV